MKEKIYRGRGIDEITEIVKTSGPLLGEIVRSTGEHIAGVEFDLVNGELYLTVDGEQYTSITNALHELAPEVATHDAEGSEGSGNVANNVIGNYAILKHVVFGSRTMYDIVGGTTTTRQPRQTGATRTKRVLVQRADPATTPAPNNLYNYFGRDSVIAIAKSMGGAEPFQAHIRSMTIQQFANEFGLTIQ